MRASAGRQQAEGARSGIRLGSLLSWHRWGGLLATLVLLVAALTGLPLVYKKQLIHWLITPEASMPADYGIGELAADLDRISARLEDIGHYRLKAPNAEEPYWALADPDEHFTLLQLDTLEPYRQNLWLLDFLEVTRELHVELMAGLFGEALLLGAGLIGVALGITGLILWWPARRGFRLRWIFPRGLKAQLLMQYHRHSGALSAVLLTLVMLTGSLMLWQPLLFPLLPPLQIDTRDESVAPGAAPSVLLQRAADEIPDAWPTYIRIGRGGSSEASIRLRLNGEWHPNGRTTVYLDMDSGEVRVSKRPDEASLGRRLINQNYPLHSGYGMNAVYLFLVFVSGIALFWLGITGIISYFRRLALRRG